MSDLPLLLKSDRATPLCTFSAISNGKPETLLPSPFMASKSSGLPYWAKTISSKPSPSTSPSAGVAVIYEPESKSNISRDYIVCDDPKI